MFLVYVLLSLLIAQTLWACPLCKEALFEPGNLTQRLGTASGYAWSIALLLTIPTLLVGGIITLIVRAQRRQGTRMKEMGMRVDTSTLAR